MGTNLALAHSESRRKRPLVWLFIDLAAGVAVTAIVWTATNQTSAIVFACFWAALIVGGLLAAASRRRQ